MKSNNKKQLTDRINRLSNVPTTQSIKKQHISFPLLLLLLSVGSFTFFAFQEITEKPIVNISSDNLNILYVGIGNPITVAVEGISNEEIKLSSDDLDFRPDGYGKYMVFPNKIGEATLLVETGEMKREMTFKVMEIPDPIAKAQGNGVTLSSGSYTVAEIQAIRGVYIDQQSVHEIGHQVTYCEVVKVGKKEDPVMRISKKAAFEDKVLELFKNAKEGDVFYIDKIRMQYPGETTERKLNSLVFKVKKAEE